MLIDPEELREFNPPRYPVGTFVARRVLELAASKDPAVLEAARALAAIVFASDEVRLARNVVEGGTFAVVHAVELAQRILARSTALDGADPCDAGVSGNTRSSGQE